MTSTRIGLLQELMALESVDHALFSVGPDLRYLVGHAAEPSERLTMLLVPREGDPVMYVPLLEAPKAPANGVEVVAWGETDDPVGLVADRCRGARAVAIGDQTWAVFLVKLSGRLPGVDWVPGSSLTGRLRVVKGPEEIEALRRAAAGVDRVLARIPSEVRFEGRAERDVAADLRRMVVEEGHDTAEFAIVASGPNGASPHHTPGTRVIELGDMVVCDFGGSVDGYHSDVTRTFAVGAVPDAAKEVHSIVAAAADAGRRAVAPDVPCEDVDRASRAVIEDAGYGEWFVHRTGHGIGLDVHEDPYLVAGNSDPLQPGMAFSVEPGIYLPDRFGVRIEDIVVCDAQGPDVLNRADRGLVVVE